MEQCGFEPRIEDNCMAVKRRNKPQNKRSKAMANSDGRVSRKAARRKDPAAVALGRKGGLVGGYARAASMTAAERTASARKAAKARWKKR
jgi:hypothetical protein